MNYFQIMHPGKHSKQQNGFKEFFFKGVFTTLSELHLSRIASENLFFEGVFIIIFRILHPKKCSKQPNDFKEFFRRYIHDYF